MSWRLKLDICVAKTIPPRSMQTIIMHNVSIAIEMLRAERRVSDGLRLLAPSEWTSPFELAEPELDGRVQSVCLVCLAKRSAPMPVPDEPTVHPRIPSGQTSSLANTLYAIVDG
jgi:hypothetical protein